MNTKLIIPTPHKPFIKGKDLFCREELKEIISFRGKIMEPEMIDLSDKMKFALIYLHSMYGKASFGIKYSSDKLIQKSIKEANFPVLNDEQLSTYCKLYNYAHISYYKNDEDLSIYVTSSHIASMNYELFHYLIIESLYDITGVSFYEHIGELKDNPTNQDLIDYYQKRRERLDPIRNNMLLFYIRNQNIFDNKLLGSISDNYKRYEVMMYEESHKRTAP